MVCGSGTFAGRFRLAFSAVDDRLQARVVLVSGSRRRGDDLSFGETDVLAAVAAVGTCARCPALEAVSRPGTVRRALSEFKRSLLVDRVMLPDRRGTLQKF